MTYKLTKIVSILVFVAQTLSFLSFLSLYLIHNGPILKGSMLFSNIFLVLFVLSIIIWIGYSLLTKYRHLQFQMLLLSAWLALVVFWEYHLMKHYVILLVIGCSIQLLSSYLFIKVWYGHGTPMIGQSE